MSWILELKRFLPLRFLWLNPIIILLGSLMTRHRVCCWLLIIKEIWIKRLRMSTTTSLDWIKLIKLETIIDYLLYYLLEIRFLTCWSLLKEIERWHWIVRLLLILISILCYQTNIIWPYNFKTIFKYESDKLIQSSLFKYYRIHSATWTGIGCQPIEWQLRSDSSASLEGSLQNKQWGKNRVF